jgi:transcriptional regulator with XRE-family HTH domain
VAPKRGSATLRRKIGERIRTLRQEAGRTQESVAWACGIAKALVSRIESGENLPSVPTLVLIAKELDVHPADIMAFDMRDPRCRLLDATRRNDANATLASLQALGLELTAERESGRRVLRVAEPVKARTKRQRERR